jgi:MFS family permease
LSLLVRDPDYRGLTVEFLVVGLTAGLVGPYMALWVVHYLHGTIVDAALLAAPQGAVSVAASFVLGRYTDRVGRRKSVVVTGTAIAGLATAALGLTRSYALALIIAGFIGLAYTAFSLGFALLGDVIHERARTNPDTAASVGLLTSLARTAFSLGFLFGPVLGGILVASIGYPGLFLLTGGLTLGASLWAWRQVRDVPHSVETAARAGRPMRGTEWMVLGLLAATGLLLFAGDTGRMTFLPLYLTGRLGYPVTAVSWLFSVSVVAELVLMPWAGALADRYGVQRIMMAGAIGQVVFFVGESVATAYAAILLLQILYAFVVSTSTGVAILFAQNSMGRHRMGLTTTTYMVTMGVAPLLNSLLAAWLDARLAPLFLVFGLLAAMALGLVLAMPRLSRRARNEDVLDQIAPTDGEPG